jgi:hypothetical protein
MNYNSVSGAPSPLHSTFEEVVGQLRHKLDPADFDIIRGSQSVQDVLKAVDDALKQSNLAHEQSRFAPFREAMANVVRWLDKNSDAMSAPQICGLSLMGLIWGGLKFIVIVR